MEKKMTKSIQRIMAMLLCVAMLLPMAVVSVHAVDSESADGNAVEFQQSETLVQDLTVEQEAELLAADTDGPLAVVYAASDFQPAKSGADDVDGGKTVMTSIVNQMWNAGYTSVNGALICGDYSNVGDTWNSSETNSVKYNDPGVDAVADVLKVRWDLDSNDKKLEDLANDKGNYGDDVVYVQGNHDPADTKGLDSFGENDTDNYGVFVIHEDYFQWCQKGTGDGNDDLGITAEEAAKTTAEALKEYLQNKVDTKDNRPIFVTSHVPLHYGYRSTAAKKGDNVYAKYVFDVLNKYGKQLNIIFLFGHNHSDAYDDYLGGAAVYLPVGDSLRVPDLGSTTNSTEYTLNFTYMNAGYLGYYGGNCGTHLSSTIFTIYEDKVVVARYDQNGEANLKDKGVEDPSSLTPTDTSYTNKDPEATIQLKKFSVDMDYSEVFNGTMSITSSSTLRISGVYGVKYKVAWSSSDSSVVAVTPSSDGMSAVLTAGKVGTAKIRAVVTEVDGDAVTLLADGVSTAAAGDENTFEYTVSVVEDTSSAPKELMPAGTFTFFKKVDNYTLGRTYMIVDMENDGPVIGQHQALELNRNPDYNKEQDVIYNSTRNVQEINASGQDVIQLPVGGNMETLILDSDRRNIEWEINGNSQDFYIRTLNTDANNTTDSEGYYQIYLSASEGDTSTNYRTDYYRSDADHDQLRMYHYGATNGGDSWMWDPNIGLYTWEKGDLFNYVLYYSQAQTDFSTYRYDVDGDTGLLTETADSRAYLFEKTTVTLSNPIIAKLSDVTGYVNKDVGYTDDEGLRRGGAQTGDNILISDGAKTYVVPVTIDMLRGTFDVTRPGTYGGLKVNYAGVDVVENYTLVVRDSATLLKNDAAREYMDTIYTLVDKMLPNRQYLIVDTDEAGIGHAMGVTNGAVTAHNVRVQKMPVDGDELLLIDSSRYSLNADPVAAGLVGRDVIDRGDINAFLYDTVSNGSSTATLNAYEAALRLVWSATQRVFPYVAGGGSPEFYNAASSDHEMLEHEYSNKYLSISGGAKDQTLKLVSTPESGSASSYYYWRSQWQYDDEGLHLDTPDTSAQTYKYDEAYIFYNWQNVDANSSTSNSANKNFQNAVVEYTHTDYNSYDLTGYRRTWIYERITNIDTISARISDKSAFVTRYVKGENESTSGATFLNDYILVDTVHSNGAVTTEQVPITISMLSGNFDLSTVGTYGNLTVTYQGVPVCTDYTLNVQEFIPIDNPEFPNEGAVKIDKQLDTTKYKYLDTGAASIDLSVTGIPAQSGVDLVIVLDASSSMRRCVHGTEMGDTCDVCGEVTEAMTRMAQMENTLQNMLAKLKEPIDGYIPDVDVAVATFNGYSVINSSYELWHSGSGVTHETGQEANEDKPDMSEIIYDFTSISEIDPAKHNPSEGMDIAINRGTNYDRAMELAYNLLKKKQEKDAHNNVSREAFVVFMSDGAPYQFNYIQGDPNLAFWGPYLTGDSSDSALQTAIQNQSSTVQTMYNLYNGSGKHWTAEAIKAPVTKADNKMIDPDANTSNQIVQVRGLGATMYTIGYGLAKDINVSKETCETVLKNMATSDAHYIVADDDDALESAFSGIANKIRRAGDAVFTDQMGAEFDLITSNVISWKETENGAEITKRITLDPTPSIVVKKYELYKRSEIGQTLTFGSTSIKVDEEDVGKKKPVEPTVIEEVTFNDNGTAAYSTIDVNGDGNKGSNDNILEGTIIHASTFWYNTDKQTTYNITVGDKSISLEPETFYWNIGDIPQDELVLSYDVYLSGSMEGQRPAGNYETNEHAELNYVNYLGNPCELKVPTPKLPWNAARVGYGFYLVNDEGKPIINQTDGTIGSFKRAVKVTDPVYRDFLLNSASEEVIAEDVSASAVLPEGYVLFDPDAVYRVNMKSNGTGSYGVTKGQGKVETTYVEGIQPEAFKTVGTYETTDYATANTVVWFAVKATVQCVPDTVVIDYGLPVNIDVLKNDTMMGNYASLTAIELASEFEYDGFDPNKKLWENLIGIPVGPGNDALFTNTELSGEYGKAEVLKDKDGKTTGEISYTLNDASTSENNGMNMKTEETFVYAVDYKGNIGTQGYYYSTVTVIPATTIYYEDNFVKYAIKDCMTDDVKSTTWRIAGDEKNAAATQDPDRPGQFSLEQLDADNIYGSDSHYKDFTTYSNGSARYCHVWSTTADNGRVNGGEYGTATFTFTGTGFDIVSVTSDKTGTIVVQVTGQSAEGQAYSKNFIVDTYYGYKREFHKVTYTYEGDKWIIKDPNDDTIINEQDMKPAQKAPENPVNGTQYITYETRWVVDPKADDALYQIPVMKVKDIPYGTYTVTITAAHRALFDHGQYDDNLQDDVIGYDFYLDAIRIYDPANDGAGNQVIEDAYVADKEGWPSYQELRNLIIAAKDFNCLTDEDSGEDSIYGIVFIDGNNALSDDNASNVEGSVSGKLENVSPAIKDYANYGPNNELYLAPGQGVAFEMNAVANAAAIHIAMKSIDGKAAKVKVYDATVNADNVKVIDVNTATDLYYDITDLNGKDVVIYNAGDREDGILSITNIKTTHTSNPNGTEGVVFMVSKRVAAVALNSLAPVEVEVPEDTIPDATEPDATEPEATEPEATEPEATEPDATEPEVTEPEVTEPEATEPEESEEFEPKKFNVKVSNSKVKVGSKVIVTVTTSADVDYIEINGTKVTSFTSSRRGQERTWKVKVTAEEAGEMNINVVCFNAAGTASQAITKTVTVNEAKPIVSNPIMDLIGKLLGKLLGGWR